MTAVVTGATGFVGRVIVRKLQDLGERVVSIDRSRGNGAVGSGSLFLEADVARLGDLLRVLSEVAPVRRIFHAAYLMGELAEADPYEAARVNVLGTVNVFEAARLLGVERVGFVGSQGIYGGQVLYGDRDIDEDDSPRAADIDLNYTHSKLLNEYTARQYFDRHGVDVRTLRAPILFGHGRTRGLTRWASSFASDPVAGRSVHLPFSAEASVCMSYVDDYVDQLLRLMEAENCTLRVYNGGGYILTGDEIRNAVSRHIPNSTLTFDPTVTRLRYAHRIPGKRFREEFEYSFPPFVDRVSDHIEVARSGS